MNRLNPEAIYSYAGQRRKMVEEQLGDRGIKDLHLLEVMSRVPDIYSRSTLFNIVPMATRLYPLVRIRQFHNRISSLL